MKLSIRKHFLCPCTFVQGTRGSKKGEVAQVIAPYEATSSEQLSLQRGQFIMIRKKSETGWWEGELQVRGKRKQIGWFPATYVKVKTSGRLSGRSTPVSGGKIQMNETILGNYIHLNTNLCLTFYLVYFCYFDVVI